MSNYWKNYYDSNGEQFDGSLLKQVGKTVNGVVISEEQVLLIIDNLISVLQLNSPDIVVDLCCGNGVLTRQLAPLVNKIVGVDYTSSLINAAKRYNDFHNIEYINSDVLSLGLKYFSGKKKIIMYEALQHFNVEQLSVLLEELCHLSEGSLFFIGSIPAKEKLRAYYDTEEKYEYYLERENEGQPHIGRWWSMEEINEIATARGFKATYLLQSPKLYTAYYRFDVVLERLQ